MCLPIQRDNIARPGWNADSVVKIAWWDQNQLNIIIAAKFSEHRERNVARALVLPCAFQCLHPASRDQLAQCAICFAVFGIGEKGKSLHYLNPRANYGPQFERVRL